MEEQHDNQLYVNPNLDEDEVMMHLQNEGATENNSTNERARIEASPELRKIESTQKHQIYDSHIDVRHHPLAIREVGSSSERGSKRKTQMHDADDLSTSSKQKMEG